ncbi:hypothetical protein [Paenibacillus rhizoplanae]|uniref:hypothetical protein n=1 Tax=Paenibacillus rhizoplanae TaxID=1917181 RepID=UPI00360C48D6
MNITWALLMMALGGVGVQNQGHEADVAAVLQSAMNPPHRRRTHNQSGRSSFTEWRRHKHLPFTKRIAGGSTP